MIRVQSICRQLRPDVPYQPRSLRRTGETSTHDMNFCESKVSPDRPTRHKRARSATPPFRDVPSTEEDHEYKRPRHYEDDDDRQRTSPCLPSFLVYFRITLAASVGVGRTERVTNRSTENSVDQDVRSCRYRSSPFCS